jgi:uncharacterized protein YutE (UPF0331/DUF86 family)
MDHVLIEKAESLERCVRQARLYYEGHEDEFAYDRMRQDAVILNLERACQMAIDLGMRVGRLRRLALPETSADIFEILRQERFIDETLASRLVGMVGFRNVAVHEYRKLELAVVRAIVEHHLDDLLRFSSIVLRGSVASPSPPNL